MTAGGPTLFRETQYFRQWWVVAAVAIIAVIGWWAFLTQIVLGRPFGEDPAPDAVIWGVFVLQGIVLPLIAWRFHLETEVTDDRVRVRFPPFRRREVAVDAILDAQSTGYRALRDYGGYGYRRRLRGDVAFIVSGDRGVRLSTGGTTHLLVGSQRPEELLAAIERARGS